MKHSNIDFSMNCPACSRKLTHKDFMFSKELLPIGITSTGTDDRDTLIYFSHDVPECRTTFTLTRDQILPLIPEMKDKESKYGDENCAGFCNTISELSECGNNCINAPIRKFILELVKNRQTNNVL